MDTKLRLVQNVITTILGTIIISAGIGLFFYGRITGKFEFGLPMFIPTMLLGWVLLMAKDSLLEGITMGVFKLNK